MSDKYDETRALVHTVYLKGVSKGTRHPRIRAHALRGAVSYLVISAVPIIVVGVLCLVWLALSLKRLEVLEDVEMFKDRAVAIIRATAIVGVLSALIVWRRAAQASLGERLWLHTEVVRRYFPRGSVARAEAVFVDVLKLKQTDDDTKTSVNRLSGEEVRLVRSQENERIEVVVRGLERGVEVEAIGSTNHWLKDPRYWEQLEFLLSEKDEHRHNSDV